MASCNQYGCSCCTCLDCDNWKESCVCEARKRAKEWIEKNKDVDDPNIFAAACLLEELMS